MLIKSSSRNSAKPNRENWEFLGYAWRGVAWVAIFKPDKPYEKLVDTVWGDPHLIVRKIVEMRKEQIEGIVRRGLAYNLPIELSLSVLKGWPKS